jgi:hypothetical protein
VVYTSPDMSAWTYRGFALSEWPTKPYGTFFTPWLTFNPSTNLFVLWFNAYLQGCCSGGWYVSATVAPPRRGTGCGVFLAPWAACRPLGEGRACTRGPWWYAVHSLAWVPLACACACVCLCRGVATSPDGINYTIVSLDVTGFYPDVDCNSLFVDDDGTGKVEWRGEGWVGGWVGGGGGGGG